MTLHWYANQPYPQWDSNPQPLVHVLYVQIPTVYIVGFDREGTGPDSYNF